MDIIKASGEKEKFEEEKIFHSLKEAGAEAKLAEKICRDVAKKIRPGLNTDEIFNEVLTCLKKENPITALRYNLKNAIMELGPDGFAFEKFVARILDDYGYVTKVGQKIKGSCSGKECVVHEVDIVSKKGDEYFMVECKYHNNRGLKSDLKVALYTYARFLDVKSTHPFCEAWLATNTKCTSQAAIFAKCRGLKIIGWHYPKGESLNEMIDKKGLYPVTILPSLSEFVKKKLSQNNVIMAKDLLRYSETDLNYAFGIHSDLSKKIREEINGLYPIA